jgi:hypothetical protein
MKTIDPFDQSKFSINCLIIISPSVFMGFLKKLKDTAEKGVEKGTDLGKQGVEKGAELGTKGYDGAKDAAKKGHEKAKND